MMWNALMIFREFRSHKLRLFFLSFCMALGIGALCATNGFSSQVRKKIQAESRQMLGADLSIRQSPMLQDDVLEIVQNQPWTDRFAVIHETLSMGQGVVEGQENSRLFEIFAIDASYPLLGELHIEPPQTPETLSRGIFVDKSLAEAWKLSVANSETEPLETLFTKGQALHIGNETLPILGIVMEDTGRQTSAFTLGPRVYVSLDFAKRSQLISSLSRSNGRILVTLLPQFTTETAQSELKSLLDSKNIGGVRIQGHSDANSSITRPIRNLNIFLDQIGLATFFLAIAGSWLAISTYLKSRTLDVAILRCLGTSPFSPTIIFTGVVLIVCAIAYALGIGLGLIFGNALPLVVKNFLPFEVDSFQFQLPPTLDLCLSFLVILLLCLPPLISLQAVTPLRILKSTESNEKKSQWLRHMLWLSSFVVAYFLIVRRAPSLKVGTSIALSITALFFLFYLANQLFVKLFHVFQDKFSLSLKIAASQLTARGNLSGIVMAVLGLSIFLTVFIQFAKDDFLGPIAQMGVDGRPNMFFADVQPHQLEDVKQQLQLANSGPLFHAPLVRGRFTSIAGVSVANRRAQQDSLPFSESENTSQDSSERLRTREQNMTYRYELTGAEEIVAGEFWDNSQLSRSEASLEKRFAERIGAEIGDVIEVNIQGVNVELKVTSLRNVKWQSLQPNFFVVAHPSVLKDAPQTHILAKEISDATQRSSLQSKLVSSFPNVTVIDVSEVARRVWTIFDTIGVITKALSAIILGCAALIMSSSLLASQFQRIREIAILRAMGTEHRTLIKSILYEFALLSGTACLIGVTFAWVAAFSFSKFVFEWDNSPNFWGAMTSTPLYMLLIILIGLFSTRQVFQLKPAGLLRSEG